MAETLTGVASGLHIVLYNLYIVRPSPFFLLDPLSIIHAIPTIPFVIPVLKTGTLALRRGHDFYYRIIRKISDRDIRDKIQSPPRKK